MLFPNKGKILNKISEFWFNFTKDFVNNHVISTSSDFPERISKHQNLKEEVCLLKN